MIQITDEELIAELKNRFEKNKNTVNELNKLNKILSEVNNKLTEAEKMKSHFISNISNEIVNPFTSILALSKSILDAEKESWKKVITMVSLIYNEAFNLDFQFKNIFSAAKIEGGEVFLEVSKVDLTGVINEVIESFKYELKKKKLRINTVFENNTEDQFAFKTDAGKIKQILSNLLNNAIKFSYENGIIEIEYFKKEDYLVIIVRDHGTGISKENQEIIFDRFKKLDSGINSINRGHGLGLSIVKAFIDILEGRIDVESFPEKGAMFKITIPESDEDIKGLALNGNEVIFGEE